MAKIMIAPGRYVQGLHVIDEIGKHIAGLGNHALILGGKRSIQSVEETVKKSCKEHAVAFAIEPFGGECSYREVNRVTEMVKKNGNNVVVGIGGGKALDTAKAVAHHCGLPVVVVPTIAATDAPCSSLSVIYTDDSVFETCLFFPKNPDVVLVDTAIIAQAPVRLLVSGMGDALATWFEADACAKSCAKNIPGGLSTAGALSLAKLCYDVLLEYGYRAKLAVERQVVTEAVERIVEANTLLSGLGFESSGLAAAHAVHNGLTALAETHQYYHGEKVAFGTLVQLILENRSGAEVNQVMDFSLSVGLPVTLEEIGVKANAEEKLMKVAEKTCAAGESIHNHVFPVTPSMVYAAILTADALGTEKKRMASLSF